MNLEELFENEKWAGYGIVVTDDANQTIDYLKTEVMEYVAGLQKRIAELEAAVNMYKQLLKTQTAYTDNATKAVMVLKADAEKRIAELEETINQLSKADASLRAQNEAQGRNAAASGKRIAELELRLGCCRDASTGKDLLIAELEKRITELDEALRALACEYEYQVCADKHYDKAMAVVNSTGSDNEH